MYSITIDGTDDADGQATLVTSETPNVHVSFSGEEGARELECDECGVTESATEPGEQCPSGYDDEESPHIFTPEPHAWLNSANVIVGDDRVTVTLSVGDPRGAFAMTVERMDDGTLRLSVPTPTNPMPHMKLTPLASDGYYAIS
jgi:hypothetical protein